MAECLVSINLGRRIPYSGSSNQPESARIRPSTEYIRIRKRQPSNNFPARYSASLASISRATPAEAAPSTRRALATAAAASQGLTLTHFRAQLDHLRDTSLTLELNLSTFGTHSRVKLGYMGDK